MKFHKPPKSRNRGLAKLKQCLSALTLIGVVGAGNTSALAAPAEEAPDFEPLASLKSMVVPEPSYYYELVKNKDAAIALGKALFWEMRIGTDGEKACATCHFSGGADNRLKNQLAPAKSFHNFDEKLPNDTLALSDFPFIKFTDVFSNDKSDSDFSAGTLERDVRDVAGSQGVFLEKFISATPGEAADETELLPIPQFTVANTGLQVYQVTQRNAPTVINSIFNLRNFWDGRAQTIFNGVNTLGKRDPNAGIYVNTNGSVDKIALEINDASIASLATEPILDTIEMSSVGRTTKDIAKRVIPMRMLEGQTVANDDSVLGQYVGPNGDGLAYTYQQAIEYIFNDSLWNSNELITVDGEDVTQMQANFGLFFGLAIQSYVATLVSDDSPFDRYMDGDDEALTDAQLAGMKVFLDKGKCVSCHDGAVFTGAAISRDSTLGSTERIERMIMGNDEEAIYDAGFYNIGVTRTEDDIGVGGVDSLGNPLSFTRLAKQGFTEFYWKELDNPNEDVSPNDRAAVDGAFKTPTLRNVELTAPYFHNGGYATLRQVVEFYNRGGNFPHNNRNNLDADIERLNLSNEEMDNLVEFLLTLTDERVTNHAAPFDHPMIEVADGFTGDKNGNGIEVDFPGAALDIGLEIPAVGQNGFANVESVIPTFTQRIGGDQFVDTDGKTRAQRKADQFAALPLPSTIYRKLDKCASEGRVCDLTDVPKPVTVYYADNKSDLERDILYTGITGITADTLDCNDGVFGDPHPSEPKECYILKE